MHEVVIYQAGGAAYGPTFQSWIISLPHKRVVRESSSISKIFAKLAIICAVLGVSILALSFAPSAWYWAKTNGKNTVSSLLYKTAVSAPASGGEHPTTVYQPRVDATLPAQATLKIASIGVDAEIHEATRENFEDALKNGVWRASDAGTPFNRSEPTILAAHRFGYLAWSNLFRRKSSFYNLPRLEVGETVEITYKQRKYVYEIYAEGRGEEITDYSADLILYTCEDLTSPVRIFKYARLLEV